jgi:ABC-type dipeptide/oligopeptide/nickel transport system permease component
MISGRQQTSTIQDFFSPPLILVTPFISFVTHHDYSYTAAELWICVVGIVVIGLLCGAIMALGGTWLRVLGTAGLLTLFVDLQFDWLDTLPHLWVPTFGIGVLVSAGQSQPHRGACLRHYTSSHLRAVRIRGS